MKVCWEVMKMRMRGEWRHAVLMHHAQESGMMAGMCMDHYIEQKAGMRTVNIAMVKRAMMEMKRLERVCRLMYRAGYLSHEGLSRILGTNQNNVEELKKNVRPEVLDIFVD